VGGVVYVWIKEYYIEQTKTSLQQNIELLSFNLKTLDNIDNIVMQIKDNLQIRTTIINNDGIVIAESHEDIKNMDNHKYRDEIMDSNKNDFGFIIRYSDTIHKEFLYVAKKFDHPLLGSYYIRMSKQLNTISHIILHLGIQVGIVVILFLIATLYVAYKISTGIQHETNKVMQFLYDLTKKKEKLLYSFRVLFGVLPDHKTSYESFKDTYKTK
jgi:hypothetical protein